MNSLQPKNKAELENILGKKLANNLLKAARSSSMKRLPSYVTITDKKPSFGLNDGGTLKAYGVNLDTSEITGERYCGSGDSALNHYREQFSEGYQAPKGHALIFVETYYNGRNTSWTLTIVTNEMIKQIGA